MSVSVIVVGVDGSPGSACAVEYLAGMAQQLGARVVAVHTFDPLTHIGEMSPPYHFDQVEARVREQLESSWTAPLREAGVTIETRLMHGTPFDCLTDAAGEANADLIVVGARGYSTLRGLALGSTSNKLLHAAGRPVLVVPRG